MKPPFYITTPIYYVNARPHLGHTYSTIAADVARRFHHIQEQETFFLTGTDEHGDKIVKAAQAEGLEPHSYADRISQLFKDLWPEYNIYPDYFIRTTNPDHIAVVRQILQEIYDAGEIYYSEYEGLYCYGCERFYTPRELIDGKCPDHGTRPEPIKESNYFFRMSRYQDWLIEYLTDHPETIQPERYRNEVLSFLREPLDDLCISRPKSRLTWGITLPFDSDYVTYVWFDALINYVSALGYPEGENFKKFWPQARHIVAKDILKPHGIYWPTMLKAAGLPIFRNLYVHGYWNVEESKMSKSLGNVVDPHYLKQSYGRDAIRFFLMREMVFGLDAGFSEEALIQRINSDLANDLGNLFSRVLGMFHKYFRAVVPAVDSDMQAEVGPELSLSARSAIDAYQEAMEDLQFHRGMAAVWGFISRMNKFVDSTAPWELAKQPEQKKRLEAVIYNLLEGLRVIAGLLYPVMPDTSLTMLSRLGYNAEKNGSLSIKALRNWGVLSPGIELGKPVSLFPRIEQKKETAQEEAAPAGESEAGEGRPQIGMEDVARLDLRVATVLDAESVPKADRLLKLTVDLGENDRRTVVAGIAKSYSPEALIGSQVLVVANLKPAKLKGIQSEGMLLAAAAKDGSTVATVEKAVPPGTPVK
ncbi:MAG: methionine--tRNA ligase [Desulfosalsimonadaceae bacterium]